MRRIKNCGKIKKEGLITSVLKSEISKADLGYMKHFNTNADNITTSDDSYDAKIRDKISVLG